MSSCEREESSILTKHTGSVTQASSKQIGKGGQLISGWVSFPCSWISPRWGCSQSLSCSLGTPDCLLTDKCLIYCSPPTDLSLPVLHSSPPQGILGKEKWGHLCAGDCRPYLSLPWRLPQDVLLRIQLIPKLIMLSSPRGISSAFLVSPGQSLSMSLDILSSFKPLIIL